MELHQLMVKDKSHRYEIVTRCGDCYMLNEIAGMTIVAGNLYGLICD